MEPLVLPARLESLEAIRRFVTEAGEVAGLEAAATYNLTLAVDEVATNIIMYGYAGRTSGCEVSMAVDLGEEALIITLEDSGTCYDPTSRTMAEGDLSKPLEERAIGGLGVYLALNSVDRFEYERVGDRNINRFVMNRRR